MDFERTVALFVGLAILAFGCGGSASTTGTTGSAGGSSSTGPGGSTLALAGSVAVTGDCAGVPFSFLCHALTLDETGSSGSPGFKFVCGRKDTPPDCTTTFDATIDVSYPPPTPGSYSHSGSTSWQPPVAGHFFVTVGPCAGYNSYLGPETDYTESLTVDDADTTGILKGTFDGHYAEGTADSGGQTLHWPGGNVHVAFDVSPGGSSAMTGAGGASDCGMGGAPPMPETIVPSSVEAFALDDTNVYATQPSFSDTERRIVRFAKSGGSELELVKNLGLVYPDAIIGSKLLFHAYFQGATGILRIPTSGGSLDNIGDSGNQGRMVVVGTTAYWPGITAQGGTIMKLGAGSSTVGSVVSGIVNGPSSIAVDGTDLYWSTLGELYRSNLDGTGEVQLTQNLYGPKNLVAAAGHVFWLGCDTPQQDHVSLRMMDAGGGLFSAPSVAAYCGPTDGIMIAGNYVYWGVAHTDGPPAIYRTRVDGMGSAEFVVQGLPRDGTYMAADAAYLYWVEGTALVRFPLPPGP